MLSKVVHKHYVVNRDYRCPVLGWDERWLNIFGGESDSGPYPTWEYDIRDATRFANKKDAEHWASEGELVLEIDVVTHVELAVQLDVSELLVAADYLEERGFRIGAEQLRIRAEQLK